jgi:hypothetical protein
MSCIDAYQSDTFQRKSRSFSERRRLDLEESAGTLIGYHLPAFMVKLQDYCKSILSFCGNLKELVLGRL